MSKHNTDITLKEDMHFQAEVDGHIVNLDADEQFGGKDKGPKPKPLLLVALGGCTAMDVVSILNKMKVKYKNFKVSVSGELKEEHPKSYKTIKITYKIEGENIPYSKIKKAVDLSLDQYCGVNALLKQVCDVSYEIIGEGIDKNS